jgi:adhesin/invasin
MMRTSSLRRNGLALIAGSWLALLLSCNVTDRDLGQAPLGPQGTPGSVLDTSLVSDSVSRNMRIFATPHTLNAGNKGKATVTVEIFDDNGNPQRGKVVRFQASQGSVTASDTTDADGVATAIFSSTPRNGEAHVYAGASVSDSITVVRTSILLSGLTVEIVPLSPDTSVGATVPVDVTVTDGDGEPVASAPVKLSGAKDEAGVTNAAGQFRTSVTRTSEGLAPITATSLGAKDEVAVSFWTTAPATRSRNLLVFADPSRLKAANGETAKIKAILFDDKHNPIAGKPISFSASAGIVTPADTTGPDGSAEATFTSVAQNANAVVTASYQQGQSIQSATTTISLTGLQIEMNPSATEVLINQTVSLSLRVRDASGRILPDVPITLTGASQSLVRTNASGNAAATVTSSEEKVVTVAASALGATDTLRIVFLTTAPCGEKCVTPGVGHLRIFAEKSSLRASNTDETTVRVIAFDKFNNPLVGRPVRFTADFGIITPIDTTDAKGEASATFRAVPHNLNARVTASMTVDDSALSVATTITLTGLRIEVAPQLKDALLNQNVPVTIRVIDGAGSPVPDVSITWNGDPGVGVTDGKGEYKTGITKGSEVRASIVASALGAIDSGSVNFWKVLPDPGSGPVDQIRKMRIFSSRSQLRADNSDFAVITVLLTNDKNNPASGDKVTFTSDLGIVTGTATVDSSGRATAILHSAPVNGTCHVRADAVGRNLTASTEVLFSGVTLKLLPNRSDLKLGEFASVEAFLKDASGNPIGGDSVSITVSDSGRFDNANKTFSTVLNPNGRALFRVGSTAAGHVIVRAKGLNTSDSLDLTFSNNTLTLSLPPNQTQVPAGGSDSVQITATYVDGSNQPLSGVTISWAANAGTIAPKSSVTGADGKTTTFLKSATFTGIATVQANAPDGVAQIPVTFTPAALKTVKLTISPDNIAANGGIATLKATVVDVQGNLVTGVDVNFRIVKGPGAGESIVKPVAATQGGEAQSQLISGSAPSAYRGVLVVASVGNLTPDTSKLTISGPAYITTVSRPENDSIVVGDVGNRDESVFEMFVGAVVQDVNGNFVADGTEVHFSAVVSGMALGRRFFAGWSGLGDSSSNVHPNYATYLQDIPFEDINNNFKYDPGIDLNLDYSNSKATRGEDVNGDGAFDWNPTDYDIWFDFNGNGRCDVGTGENETVTIKGKVLFADLNQNGVRDLSEMLFDADGDGVCDEPPSGDYPFSTWESRLFLPVLPFRDNEFAVTIEVSAVTKNGVAKARLRYPRQFSRRLFVTINAEVNGVRDKDGERFILPQIVSQ